MEKYYLRPGYIYISMVPAQITTILGSCVSVCLFDTEMHWGGMNHFLLPDILKNRERSTMYGIDAMHRLINELIECGSLLKNLTAGIVGGGFIKGNGNSAEVAGMNITCARNILSEFHIPVNLENTGGTHGRKLVFYTETGVINVGMIGGAVLEKDFNALSR